MPFPGILVYFIHLVSFVLFLCFNSARDQKEGLDFDRQALGQRAIILAHVPGFADRFYEKMVCQWHLIPPSSWC